MMGQLSNFWWVFILLGFLAGVISGTLGLGSGTIIIPVLVLFAGLEQKTAQGTALAVMVPMALVGAILYWRNPEVQMNAVVIVLIVLGALAGTLVGTRIASWLPGWTLQKVFAVFLAIVAIKMFFASSKTKEPDLVGSSIRQGSVKSIEQGDTTNESGR
jgi:hypothetical protein